MRVLSLTLFVLGILAMALPAHAQAGAEGTLNRRIDLARQMHEIKPLAVEIEDSVRQLSLRYPEDVRVLFVSRMMQTFDRETMTEISVKAMAETFTVAELEKMVDFYGSPEGRSIAGKTPVYESLVQPEILKRIDKALMEIRTGKAADTP